MKKGGSFLGGGLYPSAYYVFRKAYFVFYLLR